MESGALSRLRFHPNAPIVPLHNALAERETYTCSGILIGRMQPFEQPKNTLSVLGLNADAVIAHREQPALVPPLGCDIHNPASLRASVLDGIAYEVLKQLLQVRSVHS